ncbi:MAG: glycosyltransferase family 4 protein [Lutibacter sp.]|nr:glycosyltransferase family 4 protein [Lutibacter sp.]
MKIAFIVTSLKNTGPIVVVHSIVKYLINKVDLIDVYYFEDASSTLIFDCDVFKINKSESISFDKYDIIHSHTLKADTYVYNFRKKIIYSKILTTIHQDTFKSFSMDYNSLVSFFLTHYWCYIQRRFDGVVSISNQIKNRYSKLLSNKITTIYNGCSIDNEIVNPNIERLIKSYKARGYKILGSYAYITKRKGLSQVIQVLNLLPDYAFVIIGEGPYLEKIKKTVEKLNVSDRVLFIPYVQAPYSYLQFMDVYMMTSYSEGFGLAMVEAALTKKSIVCSDIPSFHEIFEENDVCFYKLDNSESLIQSIKLAYNERAKRGELAYSKADRFFTAKKMAHNHLHYYKKILNC